MERDRDKNRKILEKIRGIEIHEYKSGLSVEEAERLYGVKAIKLASNENPYGPTPKVYDALRNFSFFNVYPKEIPELKQALADYLGVEESRIVLGAGSDGVMDSIFKMFVDKGDEVIIPIPTFSYYHTLSSIYSARVINVERREDFGIDVDAILNAVSNKTKLIFICSPNNPTGNSERFEDVKAIVESVDCAVFIDEAYAEFADENLLKLSDYENVIISRTFSKAFGLANLRIGYAVMDEELVKYYKAVSPPFPVSTIAQLCALQCLGDLEYMRDCVEKIKAERERLFRELKKRGIKAFPSQANFLFTKSPIKASEFVLELIKRGVIVRDCSNFLGCDEFSVRVSVGKPEENDAFLRALDDLLANL
ncbi:histidinol-phosphate transaminase [Archaeoglobus profundus]|uniref:Histidinol-phosphate aminotransferase n=1 Tax=Archaeoglobus profundus (strain DSM 5631 / JCM 9629 / NBRC 100127 / Av18) TaxID=572546 RepID=D2RDV2_ARCPA|nr:histidinol-phosphate transaminase [Archaeoglobus profundus]ADB58296.1 histidinol-phosphate aminotransferase [Archaeoglobus profundus DSM 5631]